MASRLFFVVYTFGLICLSWAQNDTWNHKNGAFYGF
jgi:hypothetical protein